MSIFFRGGYPQFNNYISPLSQLYGQTSMTSAAGERVDEWTALGLTTAFRCVQINSDTLASMTLRQFETVGGRKTAMPLSAIIADPDPETNTYELVHQTVATLLLHGNAYLKIDRDRRGNPVGLLALHPYQMQVLPSGNMSQRMYLHLGNEIPREDMLHIRLMTPPQSLVGISPLNQNRNTIGLALAMDRHLGQFYGEGGTPSSVLETDGKLTIDQARIIQNTWEATHRRHRKPAVLSDGLKWKPISASAADQQMIETREQIVRDIARIFGVPSHLIGATGDSQTYQNVEQANLNYLTHTILPLMRRLETAFSTLLPKGTELAFDTSALLRTDALTAARVAATKIMAGTLNPNEARMLDGLEPYDGGEVFNQALAGAITAGGSNNPSLGVDDDPSVPMMGVLDNG